jgi:rhodanese-related sulfurtransferase
LELSVQEVHRILREDPGIRLLDVRDDFEREIASIHGAEALTEGAVAELLAAGDREARYVFMCHHGVRSFQATQFFASHGFKNVASMRGGIDAWAREIDASVPVY